MSNNSKKGGGYKKPPHHTRWKKGQSGNPNGRPKKDTSLQRISNEHMHKIIINAGLMPVDYTENGKKKTAAALELMLTQLAKKGAAGDMRAAKLYLNLMIQSTSINDKMLHEWITSWVSLQAEVIDVQNKKGTFEHYEVMRRYYSFKRDMRKIEGADMWPYDAEEPVSTEDWMMFLNHYEALKKRVTDLAPWPLQYPSEGY